MHLRYIHLHSYINATCFDDILRDNLMFFWPCIMNWLYINYPLLCTDYYLFVKYLSPLHVSSLKCSSSGGYSCTHATYGTVTLYESSWWLVGTQLESSLKLCTYKPPGTLIESDSTICCMCTTVSSWRWMSTWGSKHVEEINILWINNNQCTKVGN